MIKCEYCKKEYNSKYILQKHQITTKKCLKIQEEINNKNLENQEIICISYNCEYCEKNFTTKQAKDKHVINCTKKFKQEIIDKDKIIDDINYKYLELLNKNTELFTEIRLLKEQLMNNDPYTTITE